MIETNLHHAIRICTWKCDQILVRCPGTKPQWNASFGRKGSGPTWSPWRQTEKSWVQLTNMVDSECIGSHGIQGLFEISLVWILLSKTSRQLKVLFQLRTFMFQNRFCRLGHMSLDMQSMIKESLFGRCIKLTTSGNQARSEIRKFVK